MGQYNQLEGMPIYFSYFVEVHENVIFSKVGDLHLNSTIITFTIKAFQVMEGGIACQRQNGSPHVCSSLECNVVSYTYT